MNDTVITIAVYACTHHDIRIAGTLEPSKLSQIQNAIECSHSLDDVLQEFEDESVCILDYHRTGHEVSRDVEFVMAGGVTQKPPGELNITTTTTTLVPSQHP